MLPNNHLINSLNLSYKIQVVVKCRYSNRGPQLYKPYSTFLGNKRVLNHELGSELDYDATSGRELDDTKSDCSKRRPPNSLRRCEKAVYILQSTNNHMNIILVFI